MPTSQHKKPRKAECYNCHRLMSVAAINDIGSLCLKCYNKLCAPRYECAKCRKLRPVGAWREEKPYCASCNKVIEICFICSRLQRVHARNEGKPLCQNCYNKRRKQTDEQFRLRSILSVRLCNALRNQGLKKKGSMTKEYGIDMNTIVDALGPRPTNNHDVDHIVPLCAFDLNDPKQVRLAFSPQNLCWLEHSKNQEKSGKRQALDMDRLIESVKGNS